MNTETRTVDIATCPWCGHKHDELPDWQDSEYEFECHGCAKLFSYTTEVTRVFVCNRVSQ